MLTVVLYNFTKKNENAALSGFAECSIFIDLREMINAGILHTTFKLFI